MKSRYFAYCRVSTANQREEGTIDVQVQAVKEYAEENGFELVEIFKDDGVSGGLELEKRAGWLSLYGELEAADVEGIILYKLDRLARDLRIQENILHDLSKKGLKVLSIKEPDLDSQDPTRILMRQILGSFAEYEKRVIAMRMTAGRAYKAKAGGYAGGGIPYGYENEDGKFIVSPTAEIVKKIYSLKAAGKSIRAICKILNAEEPRPRRAKKWNVSTVHYILKNEIYAGKYVYSDIASDRLDLRLIRSVNNY